MGGFAIGARVALLWQHIGNAEPSGNPPGPPHAARMPHTHATHAGEDPLTGDNMDAPAACVSSILSILRGVLTRARNVSEYMIVLALCLVMAALCNRGPLYFCPVISIYLSSIYLSFFPRLISMATDWISTILLHMAWP